MADIAPLRAWHFDREVLTRVIAPPYDVIAPDERSELAARSPHNIVHLDLPEGDGDEKYERAARLLRTWIAEGGLKRDEKPCLWTYEQIFDPPDGGARINRRGFFALVRAEPYEKRTVLPHERTLSAPKEDRYKLFCATKAALSPVFFLYSGKGLKGVAQTLSSSSRYIEFASDDGIEHRLGRVTDPNEIAQVVEELRPQSFLIADGHHRYETTVGYANEIDAERARLGEPRRDNGTHRYALAFLVDMEDPGLIVFPTHRLVCRLPDFAPPAFMSALEETFQVSRAQGTTAESLTSELAEAGKRGPSFMAVFPDGRAFILTLRAATTPGGQEPPSLRSKPGILRRLDVVILHTLILEEVLRITPERQTQQANLFYIKSTSEALARIRAGEGNVLFLLNPTPVDAVKRVCEAGEILPQKSTYFHPKVPSGLFIHLLNPEESVD